jgi:pimeloyl-ACP methyl ester carboxylesterase
VPAGAVRLPAVRLPGPSAVRNLTGAVSVATRTAVGLVSPRAAPAAARIHDPLPPGLMIPVPGVGELFVRDTHPQGGGRLGTVLLLHGWLMASDINWWLVYQPLRRAGWRGIALDARGHGRGLRPEGPFRIADCAEDAAALLHVLSPGRVVVVGYSMGGAVAQVLARRHPELLAGAVLCATAAEWQGGRRLPLSWLAMSVLQMWWRLAPRQVWTGAVRVHAARPPEWFGGELTRGAAWDIAEAGREIGRFNSRPWLHTLTVPCAVVATTEDRLVPIARQRALAEALQAAVIEVRAGHFAPLTDTDMLIDGLLRALVAIPRQADATDPRSSAGGARPRRRSLRLGCRGDEVALAQRLLTLSGHGVGQVDGLYGPATAAAVCRFQAAHGLLPANGRIGARMWVALERVDGAAPRP